MMPTGIVESSKYAAIPRIGWEAPSVDVFLLQPRRIVSLQQMIPILSSIINDLVEGVREISQQLASAQSARGADALLTPEETQRVTDWVMEIRPLAEACEFETAALRTYFITNALEAGCTLSSLATEMTVLGQSIGMDCDKKLFLYVTKEEARYYEQDAMFGAAVEQAC